LHDAKARARCGDRSFDKAGAASRDRSNGDAERAAEAQWGGTIQSILKLDSGGLLGSAEESSSSPSRAAQRDLHPLRRQRVFA
jgi:hypothetical protein